MNSYSPSYLDKIVKQSEAASIAAIARKIKKRVVFTNGCFDILHSGHAVYLDQARSLGDLLIVGLNSDYSVSMLNKGADRPIRSQDFRAHTLAALACVDVVTLFNEDTPAELIKLIRPDILVKGGDWTIDNIVGSDTVTSDGGKVFSLPFVEGESSTLIIEKIRRGK